ncbi:MULTISPECIES: carbon-nitrogen family hydrolase [Crateriforma]|uniref:2-oxoglutaramate amidase n=1 Tax=Crateriforma conspicua TaxID=2527996 RepID=A0A5C6FN43_9PLAN|nr:MULTISPECIES: carbon-nitrogen family hydrolase [Crateriforma]TWU62048.1 2-oxoglutaramate amidase [Crateriforma conspicua]
MKLTVSLGQMDIVPGDLEANIVKARQMVRNAADAGADVLVLPELWSTGYVLKRAGELADAVGHGVFAEVQQLAEEHSIHIVGSCLSKDASNQYANTSVWTAPGGRTLGQYNKLHLFRLMHEDQYLKSGDRPVLIDSPWGKAGMAICYDLRFPELFASYATNGAIMVLIPAQWPKVRVEHWKTLLRARAIENQMFVIACNCVGQIGPTVFGGHSCVIDPWGEIQIQAGDQEELVTTVIDTDLIDDVRSRIPVFSDRRTDLFQF